MIYGPSGPTLKQLGIEKDAQAEKAPPKLPDQIAHALIDAEIDPAKTADKTDSDLLNVPGIGPKALKDIRAAEQGK